MSKSTENTEIIDTMAADVVSWLWKKEAKASKPITTSDVWEGMTKYVLKKYPGYDDARGFVYSIYDTAIRKAWYQFKKERIAKLGQMTEGDVHEKLTDYPETSCDAIMILKKGGYADGNIDAIHRAVAEVLFFQKVPAPPDLYSEACQRYGRAIAKYILSQQSERDERASANNTAEETGNCRQGNKRASEQKQLSPSQTMTPHQFFKETFNLRLGDYLDGMLSYITGKPVLDPFKFDDWLHEQHGNYEETGQSMQTLLVEKYGQDVADRVHKLITD